APDGRPPRQVLRDNLAAHRIEALVVCAPEEAPTPDESGCELVLVDGQHDYASVRDDFERFAPLLRPGGLLVFHDYADYCSDVRPCVDDVLLDEAYRLVAHVASLIALAKAEQSAEGAA